MKIKKKILSILSVALLASMFSAGSVHAGDYDQAQDFSTLSTAFYDAMRDMQKDDGKIEGDKDKDSGGDSEKEEKNEDSGDKDKEKVPKGEAYAANFKAILSAGNFGNTGILYGPITVSKNIDPTGVLSTTNGLAYSGIQGKDDETWSGGKVKAYYEFGRGISNLKQTAMKNSPAFLGFDKTVDSFTQIATAISRAGIKIVNDYNPAPVLLAFYDSSVLTDGKYAGDNGNKLINLINGVPTLVEFIKFFGDKTAFGVSFAFVMVVTLGILGIMFAVFGKIWNGKKTSIAVRRFIVRVLVAGVAFPVVCYLFSNALSFINDSLVDADKGGAQKIAQTNLNLYDWYKNTGFALPPGVNLEVKNGQMTLTPDIIYAINKNSSKTAKTARKELSDNGNYNFDDWDHPGSGAADKIAKDPSSGGNGGIVLQGDATDDEITSRLIEYGSKNKNSVDVSFLPPTVDGLAGGDTAQKFWGSGELQGIADKVGKNEKLSDEILKKITANKYLTTNGLTYDNNGSSFNFRYNGPGFGMSPIAAYNLIATEFDANGFQVKNNVKHVVIPAVVAGADSPVYKGAPTSKNAPQMNAFVKFVAIMTICFAGFKALFDILSTGFGAVFRGGVGAAMGRSASIGNIIGSLVVLILGVIGLSILINLVLISMNYLYGMLDGLLRGKGGVLDEASNAIKDVFNEIGWFGKILNWAFKGIGDFVLLMLIIIAFPKMLKIPITGYAEFLKGIPNMISEKAARWEAQFVGDYHAGGMRGGRGTSGGSGISSAFAGAKDQAKAMGVGAAMIAGGIMSSVGSKLSGESIGKDGDTTNIDDTKNDELTIDNGKENFEEVENPTNINKDGVEVEGDVTQGDQKFENEVKTPEQLEKEREKQEALRKAEEAKEKEAAEKAEAQRLEQAKKEADDVKKAEEAKKAADLREKAQGIASETENVVENETNPDIKDVDNIQSGDGKHIAGEKSSEEKPKEGAVEKPDEKDKGKDFKETDPKKDGLSVDKPDETKVDSSVGDEVNKFDGTSKDNAVTNLDTDEVNDFKDLSMSEIEEKVEDVEKDSGTETTVNGDNLQESKEHIQSVNDVVDSDNTVQNNKQDTSENFNNLNKKVDNLSNDTTELSDVKNDLKNSIATKDDVKAIHNETNPVLEKVEKPTSLEKPSHVETPASKETSGVASETKSEKTRLAHPINSETSHTPSRKVEESSGSGTSSVAESGKETKKSKFGERTSTLRKATGRSLQAMGGYAHGDHQAKKQIAAGALHVLGGMSGTQKLTGKVAQKAIDSKNARLAEHGIDITSTLNADGVSDLGTIKRRADGKAQKRKAKTERKLKRKAEGKDLKTKSEKLVSRAVTSLSSSKKSDRTVEKKEPLKKPKK